MFTLFKVVWHALQADAVYGKTDVFGRLPFSMSATPSGPSATPHDLPQRSAGLVVLARKQKLLGRYRGHMILSTRSFVELRRYKAEYYEGGLSPLDFSMRPNASTHNPGTVAIRLCMNGLRVCVF